MKNLFAALVATTALAISTPVFADAHMMKMGAEVTAKSGDFYAQDFIGKELYVREADWDENYLYADGWDTEWENIGEVENMILNQDGSVRAVLVDVGGFLNIGERRVAMPMDAIKFYYDDGSWDNYFIAVNARRADVEALPEYTMLTAEERGRLYMGN